jgi:Zn ribbon nucleic-acid-binding protein
VAFEKIHVSGPEPAERSQPGIHLLKWYRFQPVETALCVHCGFHETGFARHTKLTLDLSNRLL